MDCSVGISSSGQGQTNEGNCPRVDTEAQEVQRDNQETTLMG